MQRFVSKRSNNTSLTFVSTQKYGNIIIQQVDTQPEESSIKLKLDEKTKSWVISYSDTSLWLQLLFSKKDICLIYLIFLYYNHVPLVFSFLSLFPGIFISFFVFFFSLKQKEKERKRKKKKRKKKKIIPVNSRLDRNPVTLDFQDIFKWKSQRKITKK